MIAKALRLIRQYHELSRNEASNKLGIPKDTLIKLESGETNATKHVLEAYSNTFDIPVSSLIFFSESLSDRKGKKTKALQRLLAGKALSILDWMTNRNEAKIKA
ncbi:helix-turn-helix domain-containing protein [Vibrio astriarenae]